MMPTVASLVATLACSTPASAKMLVGLRVGEGGYEADANLAAR